MNLDTLVVESVTDRVFDNVYADVMRDISKDESSAVENNILKIVESTIKHVIRCNNGEE